MKNNKELRAKMYIGEDTFSNNAKLEQFKYYQLNGNTVRVAIGRMVEVPLWVAERAKEIGDIKDFEVIK